MKKYTQKSIFHSFFDNVDVCIILHEISSNRGWMHWSYFPHPLCLWPVLTSLSMHIIFHDNPAHRMYPHVTFPPQSHLTLPISQYQPVTGVPPRYIMVVSHPRIPHMGCIMLRRRQKLSSWRGQVLPQTANQDQLQSDLWKHRGTYVTFLIAMMSKNGWNVLKSYHNYLS